MWATNSITHHLLVTPSGAIRSIFLAVALAPWAHPSHAGQRATQGVAHPSPAPSSAPTGPKNLPQPRSTLPIDIEALARGYDQAFRTAAPPEMAVRPQLMIFVSFSMPETSLRRLGEQASKAGAVLILKGLNEGSLVKTAAAVHHLYGDRPAPLQIDPQAFSRFAVASVPTFVLIQPGAQWRECTSGYCLPPDSYAKATGDVSLEYVLEHMARTSTPIATSARHLLRSLGR